LFYGVFELPLSLSRNAQKRDKKKSNKNKTTEGGGKKKEEKKAAFFVMSRDGLFRFFFPCF
jgi:hypothetical protein